MEKEKPQTIICAGKGEQKQPEINQPLSKKNCPLGIDVARLKP